MANQQHKTNTNKHTTKGETQIPQPDMRFAIQQRSKANSKRGRAQQKQPRTRICHGHNGKKPLCRHLRNGTNELFATQKVKHAFLIVAADRQRRNAPIAVHNCVLASQSPLIRKRNSRSMCGLCCSGAWAVQQRVPLDRASVPAAVQPGPWLRPAISYSPYRTRQTCQRDRATGQLRPKIKRIQG